MKRIYILGVSVILVITVFLVVWHINSYKFKISELKKEVSNLEIPSQSELESYDFKNFVQKISSVNQVTIEIQRLQKNQKEIIDESTLLQKLFISAPDDKWIEIESNKVCGAYSLLPQIFYNTSNQLASSLIESSKNKNQNIRELAANWKVENKTLNELALKCDSFGTGFCGTNTEITTKLQSYKTADLIEITIDQGIETSNSVELLLKETLNIAKSAYEATSSLNNSASANDIYNVLLIWRRALANANAANSQLQIQSVQNNLEPLMAGLIAPTEEKTNDLISDIERSKNSVENFYSEAKKEESTTLGWLARRVRSGLINTVKELKEFGNNAKQVYSEYSGRLSETVDEVFSNSLNSSASLIGDIMNVYQESQKSDLERFVESGNGLGLIAGFFVVLILLLIIASRIGKKV